MRWLFLVLVLVPIPSLAVADGACCVGSGCIVTTEAECESAMGYYWGDDTSCGLGQCDDYVSCCTYDGGCVTITGDDCDALEGGTNLSGVVACADVVGICAANYTYGACCAPDGSCTLVLEGDCEGSWQSATLCDPNPCPEPSPSTPGSSARRRHLREKLEEG
jgi:hypothetical protein